VVKGRGVADAGIKNKHANFAWGDVRGQSRIGPGVKKKVTGQEPEVLFNCFKQIHNIKKSRNGVIDNVGGGPSRLGAAQHCQPTTLYRNAKGANLRRDRPPERMGLITVTKGVLRRARRSRQSYEIEGPETMPI